MRKQKIETKKIVLREMNKTIKWISISFLRRRTRSDYYTLKEILDSLIKEGKVLSIFSSNGQFYALTKNLKKMSIIYMGKRNKMGEISKWLK